MNTLTVIEIPAPRTPVARHLALAPLDPRLTLAEELLHAGADPDDLADEWLLSTPRRSLLGRLLGRA